MGWKEWEKMSTDKITVYHYKSVPWWVQIFRWLRAIFFGWWVLWMYHPNPYFSFQYGGVPMTAGWESSWSGDMQSCLDALHRIPEGLNVTCAPAGVLLRPLSIIKGQETPKAFRPHYEFDVMGD